MKNKLEIIKLLTQSTGVDNESKKGEYIQYNEYGRIDTEISETLTKAQKILDDDFEEKGIEAYKLFKDYAIIDFIENDNFKEEDFYIIIELSKLTEIYFGDYHNAYTGYKERSLEILKSDLINTDKSKNPELYKYLELFNKVLEKYNWNVAWGLNTVFENIPNARKYIKE